MEKSTLQTETVYSQVNDTLTKTDLINSKIWENCMHPTDVDEKDIKGWWKHTIKFDGVTPVQHLKAKQI